MAKKHVLVIGAGAAGLIAARELLRDGLEVTVVEARTRVGGRIWTRSAGTSIIELGAELIHGQPKSTFELLHSAGGRALRLDAPRLMSRNGDIHSGARFEVPIGNVLSRVSLEEPDESLADLLRHEHIRGERARRTRAYVESFHAAPIDDVSTHALLRSRRSGIALHDDHQYVLADGYGPLMQALADEVKSHGALLLRHVVDEVRWGRSTVEVRCTVDGHHRSLRADRVVVTLPLGVLRSGAVRFSPSLDEKRQAMRALGAGAAQRFVLTLSRPIWTDSKKKEIRESWGFLFTDDEHVPAIWRRPGDETLVAWAGGPYVASLPPSPAAREVMVLSSLARHLHVEVEAIERACVRIDTHDWQHDPFSRGAYSYHRPGGEDAMRTLAAPVANTVFFAGEAVDLRFQNGTVHGALSSGLRAAHLVYASTLTPFTDARNLYAVH